MTKALFVTDIGYYPDARYHYRQRQEGSVQNILIYCINGKGWIETGFTRKKVQKDQYFIIPANVPHCYGADNRDPWTIYWLHFTGEISNLFARKDFAITSLDPIENVAKDRRIRLFEELYQNLVMGYSTENIEYASVCLWYLLGSFNYIQQFERMRVVQRDDVIEKSIIYMHDHIDKSISLAELSSFCGYSVSHFSLIFRNKTSRSPIEYFNGLKMQRACQLLDFTDMRINEIASELAFEDQFYFSRLFRKITGMSPAEYRKKAKG